MTTPQVYISKCCGKIAIEDYHPEDHSDEPQETYRCSKCGKNPCEIEDDAVCKYCLGKGEVLVMGKVYANEPHEALVDTEKCECMKKDPDDEPSQDRHE